MSSKDKPQTFQEQFDTLNLDAPTLKASPTKTIVPPAEYSSDTKSLPVMRTAPATPDATGDLQVMGMIGEGGMGVVQLANQVALDRQVAVKSLREGQNPGAVRGLLQEAFVTGHLEHPNIIPVYNLGKDTTGKPLMVMKRIEGVSWLDVLLDPRRAPDHQEADRAWHLRILMSVCDAVRFAHSKHIVHRDIKPENVMIGGFGEVYLLDWGIAISTDDATESKAQFPHRSRVSGLAGTPCYMAPEMTNDDANDIDNRTDVYLLGACLHEVLTGETRHKGSSLFEIMASAFHSEPIEYPADIPAELAAIANKAMSVDRDARYANVEEFKQAIQGYFEHRQSVQLTRESRSTLFEIRQLLDREVLDEDAEQRLHDLFIETRFGFKQALKSWSGNLEAKNSLRDTLTLLFHHHMESGELAAAKTVLGEIDDPEPELAQALERALSEQAKAEKEFEKLKNFREQFDFSFGAKARSLTALILGALWTTSILFYYDPTTAMTPVGYEELYWRLFTNLAVPVFILILVAPRIFRNRGGKQIFAVVVAAVAAILTVRMIATVYMVPRVAAQTAEWCLYGVAVVGIGAISERRIATMGGAYVVAAGLAAYYMEYYQLFLAAAHAFVFTRMAYVWWPKTKKKS